MCRGNDHNGRRCPASLDKARRSEQNRRYYQSHKKLTSKKALEVGQLSSGGNLLSSVLREFFSPKGTDELPSSYVWFASQMEGNANKQPAFIDSIRAEFDRGFTNGDTEYNLKTTGIRIRGHDYPDVSVIVEGNIFDANNEQVGYWERKVFFPKDQPAYAEYSALEVKGKYQGKGVGTKALRMFDEIMRKWGVENVIIEANLDVGGYAWAKSGYDWDTSMTAHMEVSARVEANAEKLWEEQQGKISTGLRTYAEQAGDPDGSIVKMADRLEEPYSVESYPTPFEVANVGRVDGSHKWAGKSVLLDSSWMGIRKI